MFKFAFANGTNNPGGTRAHDASHTHPHPEAPRLSEPAALTNLTGAFPLSMATAGTAVRIVALRCGSSAERRMTHMGLNAGAQVRVVQHQGGGLVVMRGESRLALGHGMAHRVLVTPV